MKPLIITAAPGEEVWSCGGFLASFYSNLRLAARIDGCEVDIRDRARVMYGVIADHNYKSYVSSQQQVDAVKLNAEALGYTWESIFWGRAYKGKLESHNRGMVAKKMLERINFYKPTDIFIEVPMLKRNLVSSDTFVLYNIILDMVLRPEFGHVNLYGFQFYNKTGVFKSISDRNYAHKLAATCMYSDLIKNTRRLKRNIDIASRANGKFIKTKYAEVFIPLKVKINNNNNHYSLI